MLNNIDSVECIYIYIQLNLNLYMFFGIQQIHYTVLPNRKMERNLFSIFQHVESLDHTIA